MKKLMGEIVITSPRYFFGINDNGSAAFLINHGNRRTLLKWQEKIFYAVVFF